MGCRTSPLSIFVLVHRVANVTDWKWLKGATDKADFGSPATTSLSLCVYDYSAGVPSLVMTASVPAGAMCKGKSCWREVPNGFRYNDGQVQYGGIRNIVLRGGNVSRVTVKGKGPSLLVPPLPLVQGSTVTVQLRRSDSNTSCWGTNYTTNVRNQTTTFKAKNY